MIGPLSWWVMSHFLYLRGTPGVGKITVARVLEADLGWRLFWFHDLKNAVVDIVKEHEIRGLMDSVSEPVMRYMMGQGHDVIFVRPSGGRKTIDGIRSIVHEYPQYVFHPVQLTATYDTLVERVTKRVDPYRISNQAGLDRYLERSESSKLDDEHVVPTDGLTPEQVAADVVARLGLKA
jgi:DNA polymerase III delta prime subunit